MTTRVASRFVAGSIVGFVGTWNVANVGALALGLSRHYKSSLAVIGLFTTAAFIGELVALLPAGALIDRFGAKRVGIAGMALCLAGNAALLAPGVALAVFIRGVIGVGVGVAFLAGSAYVRTADESSLFQGLYGGVSLSAAGFALAVMPQLTGTYGWKAPYLSAMALAVGGIVLVAFGPPTPRQVRARGAVSLPRLAVDRRLVHLGMLSAAGFGSCVVIGNWAPTLLASAHGYAKSTAGVIAGLTIFLGIVGRPAGGIVARRLPMLTRTFILAAFALGAVATAVLALGSTLAVMVVAAMVIGVAGGTPFGPIMFGATRVYPDAPGAAIGAMNIYPALAIVVVTPLVGLTFKLPGDGRIGFLALSLLWALAACTIPPVSALT